MNNATPLPLKFTQKPVMPAKPTPSLQKENTPNYVGVGVIIGFIVALGIVGGLYYKMKLDSTANLAKSNPAKIIPQPTLPEVIIITPEPTTPKVKATPAVVQSPKDLVTQQNVLDNTDFTSISSELDKNLADAAGFAQ